MVEPTRSLPVEVVIGLILGPLLVLLGVYIWRKPDSYSCEFSFMGYEKWFSPKGLRMYKRIVAMAFVLVGIWFIVGPILTLLQHH